MFKADFFKNILQMKKRTIAIIAAILLISVSGGVLAKYIYTKNGGSLFSAKEFYFTSDLLTEDGAKYVLNSTASEVSFTLGNFGDKLRYSQDNIKYEVSVVEKNGGTDHEIQF